MHKEKLYDMLCEELDKIAEKGELTAGSLETIDKITHSLKSLSTVMAMEDYSNDDGSYRNSNGMSYRNSMNRGSSYRGGSYAQRRDGRYSRGYSRDEDRIVEQLEDLMEDAPDSKTKKAIEKAIHQLEQ